LKGARVVGGGDGAIAIVMVAIGSKAAADVRTGHITNHTTGDEPVWSTEKRSGSCPKGHVVDPLSRVSQNWRVAAHITRQIEPQARLHFSALERHADQRLERAKVERRSAASP
jgi:hypothetical protein